MTTPSLNANVGVVVIGRNEGKRLVACLNSILNCVQHIVYVDSGSTDDSVNIANSLGATVVNLNLDIPFTAARARNEGFKRLMEATEQIDFVQFVDGDCIVNDEWIAFAVAFLKTNPQVAVACGRRRELYPNNSIYNQFCDNEWNTPVGEARACGGDALFKAQVFEQVGGFREGLIAGEEPELCIRVRQAGYKIWRLDHEMTNHDAAILKFSQWWKRAMRGGYAYAEGSALHGAPPENHWVAESRRAWFWGALMPFFLLSTLIIKPKYLLIFLIIYMAQFLRLIYKQPELSKFNILNAIFMMLGKHAEAYGQVKYYWNKYTRKTSQLIEYK